MTGFLLDANVLIALTITEHEHHDEAAAWFARVEGFAVCPVVEGSLVRFLLRMGESSMTALTILHSVRAHPRAQFWPDSLSYLDLDLSHVRGHRQVTDTYLAGLAAARGARLATFDTGLAALRPEGTYLIAR